MLIEVEKSFLSGKISAPPSKSMAHRALICGALGGGSLVSNIAYSKDIEATLDCLKELGAQIKKGDTSVELGGIDINNVSDNVRLFCNESGSTLRFLIPLCLVTGKRITLYGKERLFERPLDIYEDICKEQGLLFEKDINSVTVCGKLTYGEYSVSGEVSSQFITGMLFALPLLDGDSVIRVTGNFESASYIDLTLNCQKMYGVDIKKEKNTFYIKGNQKYQANNYIVEGDCSNAAFLEAFNCLGGNVLVDGVPEMTLQGDRVYKDIFSGLSSGKNTFDLSDCPDLAPIAFTVASCYGGAEFNGTARLKLKESDRAKAMAEELKKFGIALEINDNSVVVKKGKITYPKETLCGHNDHRIVMSLIVLCTLTGGTIEGAEAVSKSYPDFIEEITKIGAKVKTIEK